MVTNIGLDRGHPYVEIGADEGEFSLVGDRVTVTSTHVVTLGPGWWDNATIVDGIYDGLAFSGDTAHGMLRRTRWLGAVDASQSVLETRDLVGYA